MLVGETTRPLALGVAQDGPGNCGDPLRSVELFAGGGGLLIGSHRAGFRPVVAAEWNTWACDTLRENQANGHPAIPTDCQIIQGDVRQIDWSTLADGIDLVAGGPPCQPFSAGGRARAADDPRDMFPATVNVIRTLRPRAFVIENVKGLTRAAFGDYLNYIELQLQHPELKCRVGERWSNHYARLQAEHTVARSDLQYSLVRTLVNAADYGVPQQRHRVFFVGFRADQETGWRFPSPTHSQAALLAAQASGDYWERLSVIKKERTVPAGAIPLDDGLCPWRTVREALAGLPDPTRTADHDFLNHVFQPGARQYPGHTGSPIDWPAKALKAGDHGVPGGENMALFPDGRVRYFTVRESARLQTFPDRWELHGAWSEAMRQLGNAVPVVLAEHVFGSVAEHLRLASARAAFAGHQQTSALEVA